MVYVSKVYVSLFTRSVSQTWYQHFCYEKLNVSSSTFFMSDKNVIGNWTEYSRLENSKKYAFLWWLFIELHGWWQNYFLNQWLQSITALRSKEKRQLKKKKGSYNISLLQKLHSAFICTYELDFFVVPSYKYSKSIDTYRDSWRSSSNYISNIKQI